VTSPHHDQIEEQEREGPVVHDRRRIDPETGRLRVPETSAPASATASGASAAPDRASFTPVPARWAAMTRP